MPKYRCSLCGVIKQMNKYDPDCDFCGDSGLGHMELIRGAEGVGARRRLLGVVKEDKEKIEDSEDWI